MDWECVVELVSNDEHWSDPGFLLVDKLLLSGFQFLLLAFLGLVLYFGEVVFVFLNRTDLPFDGVVVEGANILIPRNAEVGLFVEESFNLVVCLFLCFVVNLARTFDSLEVIS